MKLVASRRYAIVGAVLLGVVSMVPSSVGADDLQLPNLKPLIPPSEFILAFPEDPNSTDPTGALRFATGAENLGPHALDMLGAPLIDTTSAEAHQCVAWDGLRCTARQRAGEFQFHADHGHWHLNDFAVYELRKLNRRGLPDMRPGGLAGTSGKVSFCLFDNQRQDEADPSDPFDNTGFYAACTGLTQGISVGWADIYDNGLPGQEILVSSVPDGDYALVVSVNPTRQILETDYTDNVTFQRIRLETVLAPGCTTTRQVRVLDE